MKRRVFCSLLALVLIFAMFCAACGQRPETSSEAENTATEAPTAEPSAEASASASPSPTPSASPTASPTPSTAPKSIYDGINPLTGETTTEDYSMARPVAVMIENNHWDDGRGQITQKGISQAAFVYEMQVEQITRCMAVFMDIEGVPEFTPVRSARSYFASVAKSYDAIYVHAGYSDDGLEYAATVTNTMTDNDNIDINNVTDVGLRYSFGGEHSMYTTSELLLNYMESINTRMEHNDVDHDYGLKFTANAAPTNGSTANNIRIVFPGTKLMEMTYDSAKGGYTGFQWNTDYVDGNTGEKVVFQNVLVLNAETKIGIDDHYHTAITTYSTDDTTTVGGTGVFFNGGYCEPITWERGGLDDCFHYYTADGEQLELGIGHTYVAFIGNNGIGEVTYS